MNDGEKNRKRNAISDDESDLYYRNKKTKEENSDEIDILLRLLMPSKRCGIIIGKGGENISAIRSKYSCRIQFSSNTNDKTLMRVLSIEGYRNNVIESVKEIIDNIDIMQTSSSSYMDICLLIPNCQVGHIIGKSGVRINKLRRDYHLQINVDSEVLPMSNEKQLVIIGSPSNVKIGIEKLIQCLFECHGLLLHNPLRPYEPTNQHMLQPPPPHPQHPMMMLTTTPVALPSYNFHNYYYQQQQQQAYYPSSSPPPPPPQQQQPSSYEPIIDIQNTIDPTTGVSQLILRIPAAYASCIIGRQGSTISSIRNASGSKLQLNEKRVGQLERVLTISGTQDGNNIAYTMVYNQMTTTIIK